MCGKGGGRRPYLRGDDQVREAVAAHCPQHGPRGSVPQTVPLLPVSWDHDGGSECNARKIGVQSCGQSSRGHLNTMLGLMQVT